MSEKEIEDGGSAFPLPNHPSVMIESGGMSLRDYFAAKVCANIDEYMAGVYYNLSVGYTDSALEQADLVARTAYVVADAMLRARMKQPTEHAVSPSVSAAQ